MKTCNNCGSELTEELKKEKIGLGYTLSSLTGHYYCTDKDCHYYGLLQIPKEILEGK